MRIVWTDEAVDNLEAIVTYISVFNPAAAQRIAQRLLAVADSLADFPNRGREAGNDLREMTIVPPYILRYRVMHADVVILRVRHGARQDNDEH